MNAGIYITVWLLVFGCRLLVFGCRLLVFGCLSLVFGCRYWLPAKATDNLQPITDNLQPIIYWYFIPQQSDHKFCLEDSTLPVYAHRIFYMFWYCLPDSSFLLVLNPETSSRDTWIRVLHGWLAQRGNKYGIISKLFETYEKVKIWFFAYFCSTNQFIILIAKSNYKLRSPTPIPSVFNQDFKEGPMC